MSQFTPDEIAADLERRAQAQRDIESQRRKTSLDRDETGFSCLHCGSPTVRPEQVGVSGLCDDCLRAD